MATIPSMVGDGFYDRNSQVQEQFIHSSAELLEDAARSIPLPKKGPLGLADLGCSEGKNSLILLQRLTDLIRQRRPQQELMITHNDLPGNNWSGLFSRLQANPYGANCWALASATSFFQTVVPPGSLHIACCYSAVHWLSQLPPVPDPSGVLFARMVEPSRALMAAQAAQDWRAFLQARAQELVPGGRLLVVGGGRDGEDVAGLKMYALLDQILQDLGRPPFVMPIYYRSEQEIKAPLEATGFKCEHFRVQRLTTPFARQLAEDGDRQAYARATTGFVRAWMEPLLPDARIYELMEQRMAADPEGTEVANVQIVAAFTRL
jgi:hypothetical protein